VRGEQGPETNQSFTIQQVARLTGLSEYTLRYYERIGLIDRVSLTRTRTRRAFPRKRAVLWDVVAPAVRRAPR
jgi:MerR family regulatory protein